MPSGWFAQQALEESKRKVIQDLLMKYAGYAILSHTWLQEEPEVTYRDATRASAAEWAQIRSARGEGYRKLEGFCDLASRVYGVAFVWMDTICIDKGSTSELDESIRSMYRWYCESSICITYLANTISLADMQNDLWFTRGWTLQELLAPKRMKFYNKDWTPLTSYDNDKMPTPMTRGQPHLSDTDCTHEVLQIINRAAGIDPRELVHFEPGINRGVASRMVWAANRRTTRDEDCAYSLMGIFAVSFPIAYGEGAERAFFRLIESIFTSFGNSLDVLN
ncbi:hypothetical protein BDZ97DRAFT_1668772, partial [Flammula alnicola]